MPFAAQPSPSLPRFSVRMRHWHRQVAFQETITQCAEFVYTHKKQTGGASQYTPELLDMSSRDVRICGYGWEHLVKPYPCC